LDIVRCTLEQDCVTYLDHDLSHFSAKVLISTVYSHGVDAKPTPQVQRRYTAADHAAARRYQRFYGGGLAMGNFIRKDDFSVFLKT
jgi:hypothetical protein